MPKRNCVYAMPACLGLLVSLVVFAHEPTPGREDKTALAPLPKFDRDVTDLYFPDARQKLGPGAPGGPVRTVVAAAPAAGGGEPSAGGSAPAAGGAAWSKLISADNIEAEVKAQVPLLAAAVKSIGNFKGNGREHAQNSLTVLTVLFGVIYKYDGEVRWKKDAAGLEKMFAQAAVNCKTSSDAAFKEAQQRSTDLADLVRGGNITAPKADDERSWGEVLYRPALMKRLEEGRADKLKGTSNKGDFTKNKEALLREAQLFAVISEVIRDKSFDSGDDAAYQTHAAEFQKQCLELVDAISTNNQDGAQSAFARVSKSCDTCHGDFR